jgi:hypothetical protein
MVSVSLGHSATRRFGSCSVAMLLCASRSTLSDKIALIGENLRSSNICWPVRWYFQKPHREILAITVSYDL